MWVAYIWLMAGVDIIVLRKIGAANQVSMAYAQNVAYACYPRLLLYFSWPKMLQQDWYWAPENGITSAQYLHCLPVHKQIMHKVLVLVYKTLYNHSAPFYMSNMLTIYQPARSVRSSASNLLLNKSLYIHVCTLHRLTFASPNLWNALPYEI